MPRELIHEIIPVGWLQCNCSILGDAETGEAIVLDPGDEIDRIQEILTRQKLKVRAIVSTHAHIDHVGGLATLHDATGAPILMHAADLDLYRALEMQAQWLGVAAPPIANVDDLLQEGAIVRWGRFQARVLHTPGHTPGSISFYLPVEAGASSTNQEPAKHDAADRNPTAAAGQNIILPRPGRLLAGDTLFAGSIGRTDLWGGSLEAILNSIRGKLLALPDDTRIFPGHGPATTIGHERESNPFLQPNFRSP